MFPEQRRTQQLRIKPVLWIMMRWSYTPHLIHLSYCDRNERTQAIHLHSPGHHLTTSWGQEDIFFWPEKKCHIIHSNWCLMPTLASLRSSRCAVFWMMHRPAFLQQFFSITCLLFLLLPAVWVSLSYTTFLLHSLPFSSPPSLMNCVCIWAWELSAAMAVPSLLSVCWPPTLSCYFFCPAIN